MDIVSHNLELIRLSKRYSVSKNSDYNYYSVSDDESCLGAVYDIIDGKWTYGITGVRDCSVDFTEIPVDSLNKLLEFTRLLATES